MPEDGGNAGILGPLLVAGHVLHAFGTFEAGASFLAAAIAALPGVVRVDAQPCREDGATSAAPPGVSPGCVEILSVRARECTYGELRVVLDDRSCFAPYAAAARNLAAQLGVILYDHGARQRLAALDDRLDARGELAIPGAASNGTALDRAATHLRLLGAVFDTSTDAVMILDGNQRILAVNEAFEALTGWAEADIRGASPRILHSGAHDRAFFWQVESAVAESGRWAGEMWSRKRDGQHFPAWVAVTAVTDPQVGARHSVVVFHDLTEEKAASEQIAFLSAHDPLTGLPFRQDVASAGEGDAPLAVLLLDLDNFRDLNDALGHDVGDTILRVIADRLLRIVGDGGWVGRHGGDEFLVVAAGLHGRDEVDAFAGEVADAVAVPVTVAGRPDVAVSASIGIATRPEDGDNLDSLVRAADAAVVTAKEAGRNNWQFSVSGPHVDRPDEPALVNALRGAADRGELTVVYQPQVSLRSREVVGVEALLRWHSPVRGDIPPSTFIPLAERHGLIVRIGVWVLRRACRDLAALPRRGGALPAVAVNVSAFQFRRDDFVPIVEEVLRESGLPPARLELELTESVLLHHPEQVREKVRRLKEIGVRLSIDEFGTCWSSLGYLECLDVDRLKIDRSFVAALHERRRAIPMAVIQLGHGLGLDVVAEGVEDAATEAELLGLGCDVGQGWHFGRPMPIGALTQWLASSAPDAAA